MRFVSKVGIFVVLFSVLLMSHNASALDLTLDLSNYEKISVPIAPNYYDYVVTNSSGTVVRTCSKAFTCEVADGQQLRVAKTNNTYDLKVGDIVTYNIVVFSNNSIVDYINWRQQNPGYGTSNFYFHKVSEFQGEGARSYSESYNQSQYYGLYDGASYNYSATYEVANIITANGNLPLGSSNQNTIDMTFQGGADTTNYRLVVGISGFQVYRKTKTSVNQEQEQATQDAADESETEAQDNSSSTQTTNLIGAFQSFVTALTSLSSTNCNVTLPFPSSLGGNMQVNICQNKDYAGNIISVFGSLTLIVFYIPFSLKILSMIYNEIRSFTNG